MVDKKRIDRKRLMDLVFVFILAISLVLMLNSAVATTVVYFKNISNESNSGYGSPYTRTVYSNLTHIINEDIQYRFNLTINHTGNMVTENISEINISFFDNFIYSAGSNKTWIDLTLLPAPAAFFANTSDTLFWNRTTVAGYIINNTNGSSFGFNLTAPTPGKFNITVTLLYNATAGSFINKTNITIIVNDTTAPEVFPVNISGRLNVTIRSNISGDLLLNVSAIDNGGIQSVMFNITLNGTGGSNVSTVYYGVNSSTSPTSYIYNLNTLRLPDNINYTLTVWVNDSNGNVNNSVQVKNFTIDNTAPNGTLTCVPDSVGTQDTVTCGCVSSDALSGMNSTDGNSYTVHPTTSYSGSYTTSCNFRDLAGNIGYAYDTYVVDAPSGGTGTGPGGSTTPSTTETKTEIWAQMTPGTSTIMSGFEPDTGVDHIQVDVSTPTQNVRIGVSKYESKPAEISVSPVSTEGVYKYLQIKTENLEGKLSKAVMRVQVEKSWVNSSGITKNDIAVYKFSNSTQQWNELPTVYREENSNYYYYEVELNSFSYFAIVAKATVTPEPEPEPTTKWLTSLIDKIPVWAWIVAGVIIVMIVVGGGFAISKKKRRRKRGY